jgi:anaerobic magnesium-protoporphyrin IX monomethyl ester cyclase
LGIRTVAGFMIGFPDDTPERIDAVLRWAQSLGPTFANFNVVTPYPGTAFFGQIKHRIAQFDYSRYSVYSPVLKYTHLTARELGKLRARCFAKFYFRSRWLTANARLLWPDLPWPRRRPQHFQGSPQQPVANDGPGKNADRQGHDRHAAGSRHAA